MYIVNTGRVTITWQTPGEDDIVQETTGQEAPAVVQQIISVLDPGESVTVHQDT